MTVSIQYCLYDCPIILQYIIPPIEDREYRFTADYLCERCGSTFPVIDDPYLEDAWQCKRTLVCSRCYPKWCAISAKARPPENVDAKIGKIVWSVV